MKNIICIIFMFIQLSVTAQYVNNPGYHPMTLTFSLIEYSSNSRIGSFGEISSVSSLFYKDAGNLGNPALLSRNSRYISYGNTYMSLMHSLVNDISLTDYDLAISINSKNSVGFRFARMYHGDIHVMGHDGQSIGTSPRENLFQLSYGYAINNKMSIGLGVKYIEYDILFNDLPYRIFLPYFTDGSRLRKLAFDIGFDYRESFPIYQNSRLNFNIGSSVSNFGSKLDLQKSGYDYKLFLPTKLKIGLLVNPDLYLSEAFRLNFEFAYQADKLLVPSEPRTDIDGRIIAGMNSDISSFQALYQSFVDSPDRFGGEMKELIHKIGAETRISYLEHFYVASRFGSYLEHKSKSNRQFNTMGLGLGVYAFSLDLFFTTSKISTNDKWGLSFSFQSDIDNFVGFFRGLRDD